MDHSTPHLYVQFGRQAGVPQAVLSASAAQIAVTEARGSGPILSLGHLAHLTGASYLYLREIVQRLRDPYQSIARPKRTGGTRFLSAPEPVLMDVHRLILRLSLKNLPLHPSSYAYQEKRTIHQCAQRHLGARWMLKFDLHDFFDHVTERDVFHTFHERGYSPLVALELARLCTRAANATYWRGSGRYDVIRSYDVNVLGRLPQGGPTSGALSNAAATALDGALNAFATNAGLVYTRYSDDMVLSTGLDFDRARAVQVIREVTRLVASHRFRLHVKKTRIITPGARHIVLGLLVDGETVRLLPEYRRRVQGHIRGVEKFGLVAHARHRGFRSVLSFVNHVDGLLAFAVSVEPAWAKEKQGEWRAALHNEGFPSKPPADLTL